MLAPKLPQLSFMPPMHRILNMRGAGSNCFSLRVVSHRHSVFPQTLNIQEGNRASD